MEWIETLNQILDFRALEIGGSAITAKHMLLFRSRSPDYPLRLPDHSSCSQ